MGTAFTALFASGLFEPTPAAAVDQIIVQSQTRTAGDSKSVNNSSKLTATLDETIANATLAFANTLGGSNSGVLGGDLFQLIDFTQQILVNNDITIINSGDIDPLIGIYARIDNSAFALANVAAASNANGTTQPGDVTQLINFDQINSLSNTIFKNNVGDITADQTGIFAAINNGLIAAFSNGLTTGSNANGAASPITLDDLTQSVVTDQINTIASAIEILNSGDIAAAAGIIAEINNQAIAGFANSAATSNANGTASIVNLDDLAQSADFAQTNSISSAITIIQSGELSNASSGIYAEIDNQAIAGFANGLAASNANGSIALVTFTLSDITQSIDFAQVNSIGSNLTIDNSSPIAAAGGISTTISNRAIAGLVNTAAASNANGQASAIMAEDAVQSINLSQANLIASAISIANGDELNAEQSGIQTLIDNESISGFLNIVDLSNANGTAAAVNADSLAQSGRVDQANSIDNQIAIANAGSLDPQEGISAEIRNLSIGSFENSISASNANGSAAIIDEEDLTQTLSLRQANAVNNSIEVANEAKIRASYTGIDLMIVNQDLSFSNSLSFFNLDDSNTSVADDLIQSADIVQSNTIANDITVTNKGSISAGGAAISAQVFNSGIVFANSATGSESQASGANGDLNQTASVTQSNTISSKIAVVNSGSIEGGTLGIFASIPDANYSASNSGSVNLDSGVASIIRVSKAESSIFIDNSGSIGAKSLFAIDTDFATTTIINRAGGVVRGFVDLTDQPDLFQNDTAGTFEARATSDFGGGNDLFKNAGVVHTAADLSTLEKTTFVNLERFENSGTISLQDHQAGDSFTISNTVGGRDLTFTAFGNSILAVDAFLASPGPNTVSDTFTVNGNVSGKTALNVVNTNHGPSGFNTQGIPVVYVNGHTNGNEFYLKKPVDAGFFEYDLFFKPTGSGVFYLKSLPGGGSHVLPHLVTSIEDVFHIGTETWFDRSADLRVLLNSGGAPSVQTGDDGVPGTSITPAVWVRGSGNWFGRDGSETTKLYGRTYQYKLDSDLSVENFQTGIDFVKTDLLSQGDILVFGLLGGWVHGDLDFDGVNRQFDVSGAQAGAYATYLKGALFVDTLFKADILKHEQTAVEFPGELDAVSFGVRTDMGYRFGSFRHGTFIEPLATIGLIWSDLEDFKAGPNHVDFDSDPNVRGRLGLRVGTTLPVWRGTTMEPFVIGSLWGNLSGEQTATLTANHAIFNFEDSPDDLWGEASAGVNFFNASANTTVFAKFDATFGNDLEGFGGKAGMRVSW